MPTDTLDPNGAGTTTGWDNGAGGAVASAAIDDYVGGGSHNSDTDLVRGPNNSDSSSFWQLTDTGIGFEPGNITQVTCKIAYRKESAGVSGGADVIALSVGMVQSDETTTLTDFVSVDTGVGTTYAELTVTLTNPNTAASKATWDAGRLRIFQDYTIQGCGDTTTRLRVSAAQVVITTVVPNPPPQITMARQIV
jgi:hypothetical protein